MLFNVGNFGVKRSFFVDTGEASSSANDGDFGVESSSTGSTSFVEDSKATLSSLDDSGVPLNSGRSSSDLVMAIVSSFFFLVKNPMDKVGNRSA